MYEVTVKDAVEYYLSIVIHHIAFDGWSTDVLFDELEEYYQYYCRKADNKEVIADIEDSSKLSNSDLIRRLPALRLQYKDFAVWQRNYLSGERLKKQVDYWNNKLNGYESLHLVTDKVRPAQIDYRGENVYFEIDEVRSNQLRELGRELGVSLYSVLLAGYCLMLRVYSNQDDIIVGTPVANRHYEGIENLIGFFVNSLALRVKIDNGLSIREYIERVGKEVIDAQLHQDLPFEKLVDELKVPKDTSRHPIFQVMFGVQGFGSKALNASVKTKVGDVIDNDTIVVNVFCI